MKKYLLFLLVIFLAGCTQNMSFHDMETHKRAPNINYEAYFYVEGSLDRSRAVFLKHPEAQIDIVASSPQITATTATYSNALAYMHEAKGLRKVVTRYVTYMEKPLGILITYDSSSLPTDKGIYEIVVELYEFKGKIYFKAYEKIGQDG